MFLSLSICHFCAKYGRCYAARHKPWGPSIAAYSEEVRIECPFYLEHVLLDKEPDRLPPHRSICETRCDRFTKTCLYATEYPHDDVPYSCPFRLEHLLIQEARNAS